ncbi:MAG: lipoyl(octanoyl) transferase [Bacilli bacterium]|nr:lipoyl(octanoyl) transferase [Bacilli bacterium]
MTERNTGLAHARPQISCSFCGQMSYQDGLDLQRQAIEQVRVGANSALYLLEHTPVITIGRQGLLEHILAEPVHLQGLGVQVFHVDRGGDVTFHGPGQLVAYPIFDLAPWQHDLHRYVRNLEEVVIRLLASFGIRAHRAKDLPGVWLGTKKICAIGAKANRYLGAKGYIMSHGLALNVNVDLSYFSLIVPCGLADKSVTSMQQELGAGLPLWEVAEQMAHQFQEIFQVELLQDRCDNENI